MKRCAITMVISTDAPDPLADTLPTLHVAQSVNEATSTLHNTFCQDHVRLQGEFGSTPFTAKTAYSLQPWRQSVMFDLSP